jgi:hypothetical protein
MIGFVPVASGEIKLTDKLSVYSDFRIRYEWDVNSDKGDTRDRARIRARMGFLYNLSQRVNFGIRLAARSNVVQSPHQNLGDIDPDTFGNGSEPRTKDSKDFGLDRAFINIRWLDNGFLWLGKNQAAIWQQAENFWDSDYQAEGAALGYWFPLGDKGKLRFQGSYSLLVEDNFEGVIQDRTAIPLQAIFEQDLGWGELTMAGSWMPIIGNKAGQLPGGKRSYYLYNAQIVLKKLPIRVLLGYEMYQGGATRLGHQLLLRAQILKDLEFRWFWDYIPLDSVPLQGAIVMDDSRFSSNYRGHQIGLWYTISPGLQIDFRVLHQDTLDENLNTTTAPGLGIWTQRTGDNTRFQTNLNIRF